jgi:hypothetical protein
VARFPVERLSALTGRVHLAGPQGRAIPAGGMLRLGTADRVFSSPVGEDGTFWLEGVPAGSHAAEVYWRGRLCRFTVSVPETGPAVQDLGDVGCGAEPRSERKETGPDGAAAVERILSDLPLAPAEEDAAPAASAPAPGLPPSLREGEGGEVAIPTASAADRASRTEI